MGREHEIEIDEPVYEDFFDHDSTCECEFCRPDEWPPVSGEGL